MSKHFPLRALAAALLACSALTSQAADFSLSGSLVYNTDVALITFGLGTASTNVDVWTDSNLSGLNFDPVAAVWRKVGGGYELLVENDDNDTIGPNQSPFDAGLHFDSLAAGDYLVTIAAAPNFAIGPFLSAGFTLDGTPPVLLSDGGQPGSNPNFPDQAGGAWSLNLTNVTSVAVVPEPSTWAMLGAGLALCGVVARRRRSSGEVTPA